MTNKPQSQVHSREEMSKKSLVGEHIAQYKLDALISEGLFAQVYLATAIDTGIRSIVKLAMPPDIEARELLSSDESQALEQITGALTTANPDPKALLEYQVSVMEQSGECFPRFYAWVDDKSRNRFGCSMERLEGNTLQELTLNGSASINSVIAAAKALKQLLVKSRYHGDLKPSNIMILDGSAKLLDPGYFGTMKSANGLSYSMNITTPLYYPRLEPDDLFAIGLMAWEVVFGKHPLRNEDAGVTISISEQLKFFLRTNELCGRDFLSPIVYLSHPERLMPGSNPSFQKIMLKLLRLRVDDDNVLDLDTGYEDIDAVIEALKKLGSYS